MSRPWMFVFAVYLAGGCAPPRRPQPPPGLLLRSTVILDARAENAADEVNAEFDINRKLGRAWIETNVIERGYENDSVSSHRMTIAGLSYDDATRTVSYALDGHRITCARLERRGWLVKYDQLESDPNACRFATRIEERSIDDGYNVTIKKFVIVKFQVYAN